MRLEGAKRGECHLVFSSGSKTLSYRTARQMGHARFEGMNMIWQGKLIELQTKDGERIDGAVES
jgi:hypothetical protein